MFCFQNVHRPASCVRDLRSHFLTYKAENLVIDVTFPQKDPTGKVFSFFDLRPGSYPYALHFWTEIFLPKKLVYC